MYIHDAPSSSHCWPAANVCSEGSMKMFSACSAWMRSRALENAAVAASGSSTSPRMRRYSW